MSDNHLNQITGVLEAIAFVLVVLAFVVLWFVTPAHATDYGTYCHYASDGEGGSRLECCDANTGACY